MMRGAFRACLALATQTHIPISHGRPLIAPALVLALASCATPLDVRPGTSYREVLSRFGPPSAEYKLGGPQAIARLEYDAGRYAPGTVMIDVDGEGRVISVRQALTREHLDRVQVGKDTRETVLREYGRPAQVQRFAMSPDLETWNYPYLLAGEWHQLMSFYFDPQGVLRRTEDGPDPEYIVSK